MKKLLNAVCSAEGTPVEVAVVGGMVLKIENGKYEYANKKGKLNHQ